MLTSAEVERHFSALPPRLLEIVLELRSLVSAEAPQAVERLDRRGITYYDPQRGGPVSAGICQIWIERDHIRLAFIHGAFLPDPRRLLQGEQIAKRFARIDAYDSAPWDDLRALIAASCRFDPYACDFNQPRTPR